MRVLLFLLLSLFMLSAFSADNLLRWHDAQHYTVQASTPLKAKRAWKLCALYPSLKDSYWLSLNYGMQEALAATVWICKSAGGRRLQPVGYPASTNRPV